jgi:hypothetical protein
MANPSVELIEVLKRTSHKLEQSQTYQWGHMGACNCGFLAQEITLFKKEEIHSRAMQGHGDWSEQLNDYCPTSGLPMDDLISEMIAFGFDADDLKNLERLSDKRILQRLPLEERNLHYNHKHDVVKYLRTWAAMAEEELIQKITLPELNTPITIL